MTVVTALAVSWKPLMNSNPNAINSARAKHARWAGGRPERAFQSDIGSSLGTGARRDTRRVRDGGVFALIVIRGRSGSPRAGRTPAAGQQHPSLAEGVRVTLG